MMGWDRSCDTVPLVTIGYHWLSLIIIDYHWLSLIITALIIIDYLKIQKTLITDSLTQLQLEI